MVQAFSPLLDDLLQPLFSRQIEQSLCIFFDGSGYVWCGKRAEAITPSYLIASKLSSSHEKSEPILQEEKVRIIPIWWSIGESNP